MSNPEASLAEVSPEILFAPVEAPARKLVSVDLRPLTGGAPHAIASNAEPVQQTEPEPKERWVARQPVSEWSSLVTFQNGVVADADCKEAAAGFQHPADLSESLTEITGFTQRVF